MYCCQKFSLKSLIRFKDVQVIDTKKREVSQQFIATANRFNLNYFKDVLVNSIYDQHIIVFDNNTTENKADKSNIKTALVYYSESFDGECDLTPIYDLPSIETLYINNQTKGSIDIGYYYPMPNLRRLSICAWEFNLDILQSLKYLKMESEMLCEFRCFELIKFKSLEELVFKSYMVNHLQMDQLPISLTYLSIKLMDIPYPNSFVSCKSLEKLKICIDDSEFEEEDVEQLSIDLAGLPNLKSFKFMEEDSSDNLIDYCFEISLPPSIKILKIFTNHVQIPSKYPMPLLERLYVDQSLLSEGKVNLSSSPSIKKLSLSTCYHPIRANTIPSVEKLTIDKPLDFRIFGQVVFPPTLTHLSIKGNHYESFKLPESLIKLNQTIKIPPLSLPQHLRQLDWKIKDTNNFVFPSSYPPHLETVNLIYLDAADFKIDIPPITKYLSIILNPNSSTQSHLLFSISNRITKPSDQSKLWLPFNTTNLTVDLWCKLDFSKKLAFRLDEVINHTNVRYLSISDTLKFSIQRLDPENKSVLVLERQTLTGGIITQRKSINNQQQYDPIYLFMNKGSSSCSKFEFNWSFEPLL
ncbi:hypothetical protein DFA_02393 [Cavenderia fasciculata]|uniref:FNIP repeat-containing protein n=1 Tax=Cavenderia fasciculata TaxID=261658 RepID=F4PZB7_CACFS|nr:uncharacterized protein DFA_02393 [Cavenderia fasciculata]EGG19146.1 hypothetical protein DFA_02393 [Cavenderia fasciculata]|eukprot:XP_004366779.1 hypothetical protein DFA_02393 [Cavenderia fasciculata]